MIARMMMMVMMTMTMMMMTLMLTRKTMLMQVIDHEEDNLSDKETYSKNIPAIGGTQISYILCCILKYPLFYSEISYIL